MQRERERLLRIEIEGNEMRLGRKVRERERENVCFVAFHVSERERRSHEAKYLYFMQKNI